MADFQRVNGILPNQYLYSTKGAQFSSATQSASDSVVTDDADGNRYIQKGVLLANITSGGETGKVGPYESGASDGRETLANLVGFCNALVNLKHGQLAIDKDVPVLYAGTVNESNVIVDGVKGTVSDEVKNACRTAKLDILFRS